MLSDQQHREISKGLGSDIYPQTAHGRSIAQRLGASFVPLDPVCTAKMTVAELIHRLSQFPQDLPVRAVAASWEGPDLLSAFSGVFHDEEDGFVDLVLDEAVSLTAKSPPLNADYLTPIESDNADIEQMILGMPIEDRGPTLADLCGGE